MFSICSANTCVSKWHDKYKIENIAKSDQGNIAFFTRILNRLTYDAQAWKNSSDKGILGE